MLIIYTFLYATFPFSTEKILHLGRHGNPNHIAEFVTVILWMENQVLLIKLLLYISGTTFHLSLLEEYSLQIGL